MSFSAEPEWKGFVMVSISSSQPVSWPTAPAVAVAPVTAVSNVGATQASARESHSDTGQGGRGSPGQGPANARSAQEGSPASSPPSAAPLLPRDRTEEAGSSPAASADEARLKAEQRQEEEQKAQEEAAQKLKLQEVLATVWKASAAVVDVVLGREQAVSAAGPVAAAATRSAVDNAVFENEAPAREQEMGQLFTLPVQARRGQEPVVYTEQGESHWGPSESGNLLNRRV